MDVPGSRQVRRKLDAASCFCFPIPLARAFFSFLLSCLPGKLRESKHSCQHGESHGGGRGRQGGWAAAPQESTEVHMGSEVCSAAPESKACRGSFGRISRYQRTKSGLMEGRIPKLRLLAENPTSEEAQSQRLRRKRWGV